MKANEANGRRETTEAQTLTNIQKEKWVCFRMYILFDAYHIFAFSDMNFFLKRFNIWWSSRSFLVARFSLWHFGSATLHMHV